jgi:hypothetical protein
MGGESMVGADPEPRMDSSGSRCVAWIAFGVYLLSLLPGGFVCFYFGFMCFLNPLIHTFPHSDNMTVLAGISWLANPILPVGMVALGVNERRTAAVWGIIALGCALCATQVNFFFQLLLPAYLIWLGSMALVVCGGLGLGVEAFDVDLVGELAGEVKPDRLERADGKPLSKPEVERMMELYDELP